MQHAIGDHALLADGRTAALVDPDGNIAWLCWPRVDSAPFLLSILDDVRGGCFSVRPADPDARLVSRRYHDSSLALHSVWRCGPADLIVDEALAWGGAPSLIRRLRSDGAACTAEVRFRPAFDAARRHATLHASGGRLTASGGEISVAVDAPGEWRVDGDTAISRFDVSPGAPACTVVLADAALQPGDAGDLDQTVSVWRHMLAATAAVHCGPLAAVALDVATCTELIKTSVAVLLGLQQRDGGGGIVAAPTTSLPQWPGSARTWDYRYCWLRDASLAGIALARAGQPAAARALGAFLGDVVGNGGPRPVFRVDGADAPAEEELPHLSGYRRATPVRIGNAAARQPQLDAPAELIELAWTLAAHADLPSSLATATAVCADWLAAHWREPDHGIWEIRGPARHYTHSRVMAAAALEGAATLAERHLIHGDVNVWRGNAGTLRAQILSTAGTALQLRDDGGGADASLALVSHVGFLPPHHSLQQGTLRLIEQRLDRNGLLERYEGRPDQLADPCGPFVFPTFWMAAALQAAGAGGDRHFKAAAAARGPLGLFGEVVDPDHGSPLGNYPQVQSHAAFLIAALTDV